MKHGWTTTLLLLALFTASHLVGIGTAAYAYDAPQSGLDAPPGVGDRPQISGAASILFILAGVGISTAVILVLARNNKTWVWQAWFSLASFIALYLLFSVYTSAWLAALLAAALAASRSTMQHPVVHNLVELFMYAGIALFLAPLFSVSTALLLILVMACYDAYAVWKSGHMVDLAEFTRDANTFPGLNLSQASSTTENPGGDASKAAPGVLGGGDILFPLLLALTVFFAAAPSSVLLAAAYAATVSLSAALGLLFLFTISTKGSYYPALPFIAAATSIAVFTIRLTHTALQPF